MVGRFGRIPLNKIIAEWEDGHPINPRLLASEVAALLRTLAPADHPIHETYASAILSAAPGHCTVTHGALADYFDGACSGRPTATVTTNSGPVPAAAVLIWRQWFHTLADEATKRALYVAGRAIPASDILSFTMVANASPAASQTERPPLPSGSEPGYTSMRQREQRREAERQAVEQLDAERVARQRAERSDADKEAVIAALKAQLLLAREEAESERRGRIESDRERTKLAEQLHDHAGIIEFMNPNNPLSPECGRLLVVAWCELTENGTVNPVDESGVGIGKLAERWWRHRFGEPANIVVKHLQWSLTSPDRKKGGMIARRRPENG